MKALTTLLLSIITLFIAIIGIIKTPFDILHSELVRLMDFAINGFKKESPEDKARRELLEALMRGKDGE